MKKIKNFILNNQYLHRIVLNTLGYSIWYLNKLTNYYPEKIRFKKRTGYKLNLKNPKSFNEKATYKKIYDRNPLLTITSDKYEVRKYIEKKLGKKEAEKILIPLLYVTDKPETIPFEKLPKNFVIKANHGSGWNIIVRNGRYNKKEIVKKCKTWLKTQFGMEKLEWCYKEIPRKIIIEKFIADEKGNVPKDYKLFVFHGNTKMIQVDSDRFQKHTRSLFDENWNYLDASLKFEQGKKTKKPKKLNELKKIAKKLCEDFEFVRADFYEVNNKIYFGEITQYPGSGSEEFKPRKKDFELGKYWKVKK